MEPDRQRKQPVGTWLKTVMIKVARTQPSKEKNYITTMMKRIEYLSFKIRQGGYAREEFAKSEIAALAWAVNKLTNIGKQDFNPEEQKD